MKVIATREGFYGAFREVGAEFDVADGEKASWFEPVKSAKSDHQAEQDSKRGKGKSPDAGGADPI